MRRSVLVVLVALVGLAGGPVAGPLGAEPAAEGSSERKITLYRAQSRPAEELLGVAQTALAGEGSASVDPATNALLLLGPASAVASALEVLRALDRPRRTVVLHYESHRLDELDAHGIRIDWSVGGASVRVGNVVFPRDASGVRIGAHVLQSEQEGGLAGLVRVLDGEVGRISSGRSVPVRSHGFYGSELAFVNAESGFEATPRVLGDGRVQVSLQPVEAELDRAGRVRFTEGATTLTLRPGETVAVGGIARTSDAHARGARVLDASQRSREERVLLLTVEVEGGSSVPAAPPD